MTISCRWPGAFCKIFLHGVRMMIRQVMYQHTDITHEEFVYDLKAAVTSVIDTTSGNTLHHN